MIDFSKRMAQSSNDELLDIVIVKPFEYQDEEVKAAELELSKRNIPDLDSLKEQLIKSHFNDLSYYTDEELKNYALLLKFNLKKSDKEVQHILRMGNLPEERCKELIAGFDKSTNYIKSEASERNNLVGALWFFGGIAVTVYSMSTAGESGSYVVAFGAIIYGLIKMTNLA